MRPTELEQIALELTKSIIATGKDFDANSAAKLYVDVLKALSAEFPDCQKRSQQRVFLILDFSENSNCFSGFCNELVIIRSR